MSGCSQFWTRSGEIYHLSTASVITEDSSSQPLNNLSTTYCILVRKKTNGAKSVQQFQFTQQQLSLQTAVETVGGRQYQFVAPLFLFLVIFCKNVSVLQKQFLFEFHKNFFYSVTNNQQNSLFQDDTSFWFLIPQSSVSSFINCRDLLTFIKKNEYVMFVS